MSKNLEVKILTTNNLTTNNLGRDDAVSAHRHGLDHDHAIETVGQGWMSQWWMWKSAERLVIEIGDWQSPAYNIAMRGIFA